MNNSTIYTSIYYIISIDLVNKSNLYNWYESPLFSCILGFIFGFFMNLIRDYIKYQKELNQYEYLLLKKTKDILESNKLNDKYIDEFLTEFYTDFRFTKLKSMTLIYDSLNKAKKGEGDYAEEILKIDVRLNQLKNGMFKSAIISLKEYYKNK